MTAIQTEEIFATEPLEVFDPVQDQVHPRDRGRREILQTNIIVATAGLAILLEDFVLKIYGGYPYPQPVKIEGTFFVGGVSITYQALVIMGVALLCIGVVAWLLRTKFGRAIRATALNRDAAMLMGVRTNTVYLQVMALAGALAGVAGLMISTLATLSPQMGKHPPCTAVRLP